MIRLVAIAVLLGGLLAAECPAPPTMLALLQEPLVLQAVHGRVAEPHTAEAWDGASTLSREWLEGKRKDWHLCGCWNLWYWRWESRTMRPIRTAGGSWRLP